MVPEFVDLKTLLYTPTCLEVPNAATNPVTKHTPDFITTLIQHS